MNLWQIAALALILLLIPAGVVISKAGPMDRLAALEFASSAAVLAMMLIAESIHRPSFFDVSLTLALLSYPASILFAHFYERWL